MAGKKELTRKGDTEGRATGNGEMVRGMGGEGSRVHWSEMDGGNNTGLEGSCSKPRPVRLADFMTMVGTVKRKREEDEYTAGIAERERERKIRARLQIMQTTKPHSSSAKRKRVIARTKTFTDKFIKKY